MIILNITQIHLPFLDDPDEPFGVTVLAGRVDISHAFALLLQARLRHQSCYPLEVEPQVGILEFGGDAPIALDRPFWIIRQLLLSVRFRMAAPPLLTADQHYFQHPADQPRRILPGQLNCPLLITPNLVLVEPVPQLHRGASSSGCYVDGSDYSSNAVVS